MTVTVETGEAAPATVDMAAEARACLELMAREQGGEPSPSRLAAVEAEIERTGTWRPTTEELAYGARVAWRNNTHCIGRLHWKGLVVRDLRHLERPEELFEACVEHLRLATNGGRIRPLMSVFAPARPGERGPRIWNPQLVRYAGYRQPDGGVLGDPLHADLTDAILGLGWEPGRRGRFDVLPLVVEVPPRPPRLFELPRDAVLEVPLSHPEHRWFGELGLRWHALPAISDMRFELGGISFTAAPFSGWYMVTEIGGRNLSDAARYDLLPAIARGLGLDTRSDRALWKDRALVELNVAVLHSFHEHGVAVVDHHTASRQFVQHEQQERRADRIVPAEWSWMIPPVSSSTSPVFHRSYPDVTLRPNFFYQPRPWERDRAT